jgi:hypothetical protein
MPGIGLAVSIGTAMKVLNPRRHYKCRLRLNRLQQWPAAQDRYDAFHVVGEHIKRHPCSMPSSRRFNDLRGVSADPTQASDRHNPASNNMTQSIE